MQFYKDYLKEREGFEVIESDSGFATYKVYGEECYIRDIYIVPEQRRKGAAAALGNQIREIAKSQGCKYLTGSVASQLPSATNNTKAMFADGYRILRTTADMIYFVKEI